MIILSIDPGVERLGVAILTKKDATIACEMSNTIITPKNLSQRERIGLIFDEVSNVCQKYRPNQIVLERIFFAKNAKTAGQAGLNATPLGRTRSIMKEIYGRQDINSL